MKIDVSIRARSDLTDITRYLSQDQPAAAVAFVRKIADRFAQLENSPHLGRPRPELGERVRGLLISPYLALYRVENRKVIILRVLHTSRNLKRATDLS